jgi:formylglycine-generating enzyme required for sulfatase activity
MSSVTAQRLLVQGLVIGTIGLGLALSSPAADKAAKKELTYIPTVKWLPKAVAVPNAEAKDQAAMKAYREVLPGSDVTFQMLPIPGGKYTRGATEAEFKRFNKEDAEAKYDEGPQHEIEIEPFWMGKCEVTWDEYELWGLGLDKQRRAVTKAKATSHDAVADAIMQPTKPYTDMTFGMGKEGYPAICVTQLAASTYCKWLSAKTGRYYRLPTEAEWEYAARAGTKTAYSFGDSADKLKDYAWYFDNSEDKYHKVGLKKPNPWGLYDIHGNVNEWVIDQYVADFYKKLAGKVSKNPIAVPKTEYPRMVRGGSWDDNAAKCRSAARRGSTKDWKMQDPQIPQSIWYLTDATFVGFRVVRPLRVPSEEESKPFEPDVEALKEFKEAQADKQ